MKLDFDKNRPMSWSQISSFEWNKEEWYAKYVVHSQCTRKFCEVADKEDSQCPVVKTNAEMKFGNLFAKSVEERAPLAPVTIFSKTEFPLTGKFGGINLIGFVDTYEPGKALIDHKTGAKPWTQKRADSHKQLDMYLFMLYLLHGVKPEKIKCAIEWVPTMQQGDFSIDFVRPITVHSFPTKRTTLDILNFGAYIKKIRKDMEQFVNTHP